MRWLATLLAAMCVALSLIGFPAAPARADEQPPLVIVFDVSGSMNDMDSSGRVKLSTAKQSMLDLVRAQPPRTSMGVWTYPGGASVDGCSAGGWINQLAPADRPDETDVDARIRQLSAGGGTPRGPALSAATTSLQQKGYDAATIVLVSDGESNCGPPPCEVARSVVSAGFDLTVAAVALDIGDEGNSELQCIADATGGSYTQADYSDELIDELSQYQSKDLLLEVEAPAKVRAGSHATFTATVSNPSNNEIVGASLLISFHDRSLVTYLPSPQYRLPVIPASGSISRTWTVGTDSRYEGVSDWRVLAGSQDAGAVLESGRLEVSQQPLTRSAGGDIMANRGGTVVLMGDSYSSGEGTGDYLQDVPDCHRSKWGYGNYFDVDADILACTGAVSQNLTRTRQFGVPPQITQLRDLRKAGVTVDMVLLTVGGNDIGFGEVVTSCFLGDCTQNWAAYLQTIADRGDHANLYRQIANEINRPADIKARDGAVAPVIVSPYPDPFWEPTQGRCNGLDTLTDWPAMTAILLSRGSRVTDPGFSATEIVLSKQILVALNKQVEAGVEEAAGQVDSDGNHYPVFFADTVAGMATGHTICQDDSYFVRLTPTNAVTYGAGGRLEELFHPNQPGHRAWADAIITWSQRTTFDASQTVPEGTAPPGWLQRLTDWLSNPIVPSVGSLDLAPEAPLPSGVFPATEETYEVTAGGLLDLHLEGLRPGSTVTIVLRSEPQTLAVVAADENGVVNAEIVVPKVASGAHTLTVSGHDPDHRFVGVTIPLRVSAGLPIGIVIVLWVALASGIALLAARLRLRRSARLD